MWLGKARAPGAWHRFGFHVYPPDGLRRSAENAGTVPRVFVGTEHKVAGTLRCAVRQGSMCT